MKTEKIDDWQLANATGYPDFVDAYIIAATWDDGTPLTEDELDELNDDRDFVYEKCIDHYF